MVAIMSAPVSFGVQLRRFRETAGMTQEQLAQAIGATWMTIHRYETDQRLPRWDDVLRLAAVFNKTPNDFVADALGDDGQLDPDDDPDRDEGKRK